MGLQFTCLLSRTYHYGRAQDLSQNSVTHGLPQDAEDQGDRIATVVGGELMHTIGDEVQLSGHLDEHRGQAHLLVYGWKRSSSESDDSPAGIASVVT